MTELTIELAVLEAEYDRLRWRLIRYGNHHPETKADLAWLVAHNPSGGLSTIDELAMLVERYRAIAVNHQSRNE